MAYYDPQRNGSAKVHPDSGKEFEGFQIPFYKQCLDLVTHAHQKFHHIYSIGWDLAITENGPVIIEGNYKWDVVAPQITESPAIMNQIFNNDSQLVSFFETEMK